MSANFQPIVMTAEYWQSSPFSIVRHYGHCSIGGHTYVIVDQRGKDIFECSEGATRLGRAMAIPDGEPCDLLRSDFKTDYRKLGRDKFLEIVLGNQRATDKELHALFKEAIRAQNSAKKAKNNPN